MKLSIEPTLAAFFLLCSFVLPASAQDCDAYFPMKEGAVFEMTSYNDKDKEQSMTRNTISELNGEGEFTATVKVQSFDKKGKETYNSEYGVACNGDHFKIDMRSMMSGENMASMQGMEVDVEADELAFPSNIQVGTDLPDASLSVSMQSAGFSMAGMKIDITNRKVLARESMTTPAGTFDCIVVTQDISTKMIVSIQASSKIWYAKNVGAVRSESYNKNGKRTGYEVLTSLKN
jgi:hypothetical protein